MSQVYIDPLAKQLILEDFKEPRMLLTQGYTLTPGEDGIDQIVVVCYSPEFRYFYDIRDDTKAEVATFPGMEPKPPRCCRLTSNGLLLSTTLHDLESLESRGACPGASCPSKDAAAGG